MPLTQNFTTSQSLATPNKITFTDTSTGTDAAVVSRRIYPTDSDGEEVVEEGTTTAYEEWSGFPGTTTITLDLLTRDTALSVRVDWVNSGGTVLYTKTISVPAIMYMKAYYIFLIKCQQSNPKHITRNNFYENIIKLLNDIKNATDSLTLIDDIKSSQAAMDRGYELINNPSYFF